MIAHCIRSFRDFRLLEHYYKGGNRTEVPLRSEYARLRVPSKLCVSKFALVTVMTVAKHIHLVAKFETRFSRLGVVPS